MKIETKKSFTVIISEDGYKLSKKDKTEMYDGKICLGKYDSIDNYIEVTILEYEEWKQNKDNEILNGTSL